MTIAELDQTSASLAHEALQRCCGAESWITAMIAARPFIEREAVFAASDAAWASCSVVDFKEAFTHHPRIGDVESLARRYSNTKQWASGEQGGVEGADREVLERLADGNRRYEERFGHLFIVCATARSVAEMLSLLEARLSNDADEEIRIAASEQHRITRIRLEKLLS